MNPKHRKALLDELTALETFMNEYPAVNNIFPDIVGKIKTLHRKVLYEKVDDKTGGLDLHAGRIAEIADFAITANALRDKFIAALNINDDLDNWVTLESLTKAKLDSQLSSKVDLFDPLVDAVKEKLASIKGEGITKKELCTELQDVLAAQYTLLDEKAITKCTSLRAIKNLNIPILEGFIDDLKKYKNLNFKDAAPDYTAFCTALNLLFAENAVVTQEVYEKEVQTWLDTVSSVLKSLETDKLAGAGIHIRLVSSSFKQQFATLPELALKLVQGELDKLILSIKESPTLTIKDFVALLDTNLKSFKMPKPSTADRAALTNPSNIRTQLAKININDAILKAVNINSPIYVVNQPSFRQNLIQKLSDWKDSLVNSLAVGADLILKLDGCVVNGGSFKANILNCTKIEAVSKVLDGLAFEELKLRGHKDLKIFDEKWGNPWKAALTTIDVEKHIIAIYENDTAMMVNLYTNLYAYLPSEDHVIATLNLSIGGKINLALEAVKKLEKRVDKISEEVKLIKEVNDLQTLALGYNSMITEVDLVFKNIIEAHKDYVNRIHLFCIEYNAAYEKVNDSVESFNEASKAIKEFWDSVWGTVKTIGTAALCATGIGGVGLLFAKIGEDMGEAVVTAGVDLVVGETDMPTLANKETTPFAVYLTEQVKGEAVVRDTLRAILQISESIQAINRFIQSALDTKKELNLASLISGYNEACAALEKWLKDQKKCINNYRAETSKLRPKANITRMNMERNMYIRVVKAQTKGEIKSENWQIICNATAFRDRLLLCSMIGKNDFVDNWGYDRGTDKELERLYAQKEVAEY